MMNIKIRKVAMSDVKCLSPLITQLGYPTTEENLIARIALYQHSDTDRAWIALDDAQNIVGCIAVHCYDLFHSTERYGRIVSLVVQQSLRRMGIGRRLIARAEYYASQKNCSALELSCSLKRTKLGSQDFYDSLGYKNDGEYETSYLRKYLKLKEGPLLA